MGITKEQLDFLRRQGVQKPFALDEATGMYTARQEAPPDWGATIDATPPQQDIVDMSGYGEDIAPTPKDYVDMSDTGGLNVSPGSIPSAIQQAISRYQNKQLDQMDNGFVGRQVGTQSSTPYHADEDKAFKAYGQSLGIEPEAPPAAPGGFEGSGLASMLGRTKDMTQAMSKPKLPVSPSANTSVGTSASMNRSGSAPTAQEPTNVLDLGTSENDSLAELRAIQAGANNARLTNSLGAAGEIIGSSIARTTPVAQQLFKDNIAQADQGVKDFKDRKALEKDDPNSPLSKGYRNFLKQMGVEVKGDFTSAMGEKLSPLYYKMFEAEESRKARKEEMGLKHEMLKVQKDAMADAKKTATDSKDTDAYRAESQKGALGKLYANYENAVSSFDIVDRYIGDGADKLDKSTASGYKDFGILFSALKALQGDDSVIRESEVRLGRAAGSFREKAAGLFKQVINGESLAASQRESIREALDILKTARLKQYQKALIPLATKAKNRGLKFDEMFGTDIMSDSIYQGIQSGDVDRKDEVAIEMLMKKRGMDRGSATKAVQEYKNKSKL